MWKIPNGSRNVVRINLAKCFPEMDPAEREQLVGQSAERHRQIPDRKRLRLDLAAQRSLDLVKEVDGLEVLGRPWPRARAWSASPATWATGKCSTTSIAASANRSSSTARRS
jgi:hypothetical protein